MKNTFLLLSFVIASIPASSFAADTVVVSGCAKPGVEAGCIVLSGDGPTYEISSAEPKPKIGQFGTVKGTVFQGASICQQGKTLKPATWTPDPSKTCDK